MDGLLPDGMSRIPSFLREGVSLSSTPKTLNLIGAPIRMQKTDFVMPEGEGPDNVRQILPSTTL
jgi:hypothetical protein